MRDLNLNAPNVRFEVRKRTLHFLLSDGPVAPRVFVVFVVVFVSVVVRVFVLVSLSLARFPRASASSAHRVASVRASRPSARL